MIESSLLHKIKKISFIIPCGISIAIITAINSNIALMIIWTLIWSSIVGLIMLKFSQKERTTLFSFILAGFLVRLVIAILFRHFHARTEGLITPDEFYYFEYSKYLAQEWKNGNLFNLLDIQRSVYTRNYGYHIYSALHFLILEDKLLIVISNIFLDIISSLIIYKLASDNFDEKLGKTAFLLFIFNPHQIYWSTLNLKDTLLCFLIILFIYSIFSLKKNRLYIIPLIISFFAITTIRFYLLFLILLIGVILIFFLRIRIKSKLIIAVSISLAATVLYFTTPLRNTFDLFIKNGTLETFKYYSSLSLENTQRREYSTNIVSGFDIKSILILISHFLFAPSPFNIQGDGKYLLYGTLFWYFLFPYYVVGSIIFLKHKDLRNKFSIIWLFPLLVIIFMIFAPGANEPRHRLMIMPFATILGSVGLNANYKHKKLVIFICWFFIIASVAGRQIMI